MAFCINTAGEKRHSKFMFVELAREIVRKQFSFRSESCTHHFKKLFFTYFGEILFCYMFDYKYCRVYVRRRIEIAARNLCGDAWFAVDFHRYRENAFFTVTRKYSVCDFFLT